MHRIGRTARSERTGTAYTFFTPGNSKQAGDLVSVLREANQEVNPKLLQLAESARGMRGGELVYFTSLDTVEVKQMLISLQGYCCSPCSAHISTFVIS